MKRKRSLKAWKKRFKGMKVIVRRDGKGKKRVIVYHPTEPRGKAKQ